MNAECGLSPRQRSQLFESFERYSILVQGQGCSNEAAFEAARRYASKPLGEWLVIAGRAGNGKTHLLSGIANTALSAGIPVLYAYVPRLLDYLRAGYSHRPAVRPWWNGDGDEEERGDSDPFEERFARLLRVDLLMLDDLGTEVDSDWVRERLTTVINHRYEHRLATVISTNLSMAEMEQRYFRLHDRVMRYPATIARNTAISYRDLCELRAGRLKPEEIRL